MNASGAAFCLPHSPMHHSVLVQGVPKPENGLDWQIGRRAVAFKLLVTRELMWGMLIVQVQASSFVKLETPIEFSISGYVENASKRADAGLLGSDEHRLEIDGARASFEGNTVYQGDENLAKALYIGTPLYFVDDEIINGRQQIAAQPLVAAERRSHVARDGVGGELRPDGSTHRMPW